MRRRAILGALFLIASVAAGVVFAEEHKPLALLPDNPHYFLFRGKPTFLITSAEHYGAVLNRDFDYVKYLDELAAHGLNNTRLFSGAYVEDDKSFNITKNTLAPATGKFICPWARSSEPGYLGGGNKFDLEKWDDAFFVRLKDFVAQASKRGVVVEMCLFCPFYDDSQWKLSPQNPTNNVKQIGPKNRNDVYTLDKHGGLLALHEALVRKFAAELAEFDNLYYEICNEPYFGGVTMPWQHRMIDVLIAAEKELPQPHLISLNIANGSAKIDKQHSAVSIFNFHYASPPKAVAENYALGKVIGENETGFKGTADDHYRMEAWEFLLAGGTLFNHLDYSFAVGHEDGTFQYPPSQPGGGNRGYRRQLKVLKDFLGGFPFPRMKPDGAVVKRIAADKTRATVLSEPGKHYAAYLHGRGPTTIELMLPKGRYGVEWISPLSGETLDKTSIETDGEKTVELKTPEFKSEIALAIRGAGL